MLNLFSLLAHTASDVLLVEAAAAPALEDLAEDVPVTDDTPARQEDKAANPEEEGDEDYDFLLVAVRYLIHP
jgi:hypothetical protein